MNTIDIIYEYDSIVSKLAEDIKKSDYKVQYFLKLLNLKSSFFYKKLREKRFTSEEMKLISKHLYPKDYQDYQEALLNDLLEKSKAQLKAGSGMDFEKTLEETKRKYGNL
jgi:hypothetical protein